MATWAASNYSIHHLPQNQWRTVTQDMRSSFPIRQMKSEMLISSGALHFRTQASDICQPAHSLGNTKNTTSHTDLKPSVIPALLPYWLAFISYYFQPVFSGSVLFSIFPSKFWIYYIQDKAMHLEIQIWCGRVPKKILMRWVLPD